MEETVLEFTAVILGFLGGLVLGTTSAGAQNNSAVRLILPFFWLALAFLIVQLV